MSERPRKAERTAMATGLASGVGTIASVAGILQILESGSLNLLLKSAVLFAVLFPVAWGIALIRKKIKKQRLHWGYWKKASVVATTVLAGALVGLFVVAIWPGNSENPCGSLAANDGDEGRPTSASSDRRQVHLSTTVRTSTSVAPCPGLATIPCGWWQSQMPVPDIAS